mgnify:CR=1 FL=1
MARDGLERGTVGLDGRVRDHYELTIDQHRPDLRVADIGLGGIGILITEALDTARIVVDDEHVLLGIDQLLDDRIANAATA